MKHRHRLTAIASIFLLMALVKVAQQLYRYYVYAEERAAIVRLEGDMDREGLGVVLTQLRADTLRREIEAVDSGLRASRQELDRLEGRVLDGWASPDVVRGYRGGLADYNLQVGRRNALYQDWRSTVESNRVHVERYNLLVDSIRALAAAMGEPYYPISSPAEIAARHEAGRAE